jgi:hypothetical protein
MAFERRSENVNGFWTMRCVQYTLFEQRFDFMAGVEIDLITELGCDSYLTSRTQPNMNCSSQMM